MTEMLVLWCPGSELRCVCFRWGTELTEPTRGRIKPDAYHHFSMQPFNWMILSHVLLVFTAQSWTRYIHNLMNLDNGS